MLESEGTHLMQVLSVDGIDSRKTSTNDILEIMEVLGIEAARGQLFKELHKVRVCSTQF